MRHPALDDWLSAVMDPRTRLELNSRFYGEAIRTDGWSCRSRREPWHLIYLALEGRSTGRAADGSDISIEPGQALWLPPRAPHDFTWTPVFRYDEIWFRLTRSGVDLSPIDRPIVFSAAAETRPLFDRLADEITMDRPLRRQSMRCLLATLTVELLRLRSSESTVRRGFTAHQRQRLMRYTQAHLADGLTAADLARVVEMSPDYFTRVFRATFGCAPRTWLTRERIRAASRLLAGSDLRIVDIARRLGYSDMPQFSRQFREVMGMSPRAFRQRAPSREVIIQSPV